MKLEQLFSIHGKVALVTGGSRGIGRSIALAFAEAGADVAIGYRREGDAANAVVKEIEALDQRGFAFSADVRDPQAVAAMLQDAREALGGLDIVVANAGVASGLRGEGGTKASISDPSW